MRPSGRGRPRSAGPAPGWLPPALVLAFYAASLLAFKPWTADFPLNDDWVYGLVARRLAEEGRLRLLDWGAATQVLHVAWGALWWKLLGGGFGALKLAVAAAAAAGVLAFERTLELLGVPAGLRALSALTLAAGPGYFCWTFSFMTDVPYLACMLAAFWAYARALTFGEDRWLAAGSLAAAGAFLIRQTGLAIPAGMTLHLLVERRLGPGRVLRLWAPPAAAWLGHALWYRLVHGPTWGMEALVAGAVAQQWAEPAAAAADLVSWGLAAWLLAGLMALPPAAGLLAASGQFLRPKEALRLSPAALGGLAAGALALALYAAWKGPMPHVGNAMGRWGLGVVTLAGAAAKPAGFFAWPAFWAAATAAAALGALAIPAAWASLKEGPDRAALRVVAVPCLLQLAPALLRDEFFDRYVLVVLPPVLLVLALAAARGRFRAAPAWACWLGLAAVSWLGVADYHAWSRAKWEAGRLGLARGLKPGEIAGGFDWDGYWTFEANMAALKAVKPLKDIGEWEWQGMNVPSAMLSFSPRPGLAKAGEVAYRTPLAPGRGTVYLLAASP